jgi:hypothetical protein
MIKTILSFEVRLFHSNPMGKNSPQNQINSNGVGDDKVFQRANTIN